MARGRLLRARQRSSPPRPPEEPRAVRVRAVALLYGLSSQEVAERFLDGLSHFGLRALDLRIADLRAEGKLP